MVVVRRAVLFASGLLLAHAMPAVAQTTTTYHLHKEASLINSANRQLETAGPDATQTALQTVNLKGSIGNFTSAIAYFETQSGVPGLSGVIPASSTVTFSLMMKVTSLPSNANIWPYVELRLNSATGQILCSSNGPATLTTTLQRQSFSCTTLATPISVATSDRFFLEVGVSVAGTVGTHNTFGELDIETNADSTVQVPNPVPNITSLSATSGIVGDAVTITGTGFLSAGTVTFNGTTASTSSWNNTTIQTSVPAGVLPGAGPVVVTVSGRSSASVSFTVVPHITTLAPSTGPFGQTVTVGGTSFGSTQGSSTVTFNGVPAAVASWSMTSIVTSVPSGATTGSVVVTVLGNPSSGVSFTVLLPTISSLNPTGAAIGQNVTINGTHFGATQGLSTVAFNGTPATPTSWSDTSINVPVPAGTATGPVVVTVGDEGSNGVTFTLITTGTVVGTITHATGGAALSGATVQAVLSGVVQGTATSAADGTYSIGNLNAGTYDIRVLAAGFSSEVRSGTAISANVTTTVNVAMLQPGSISGSVTQSDGVTPIAGAAVTLYSGSLQAGSVSTDGTGGYSITNLHPGAYTVRASDVGFRTKEQGASIAESANTTSNLSLDPAGTGGVSYVYDELGRLVQVTDPSGDTAIYHYDLVGNLTSIERPGATGVSISDFTPNSGPVGTTVTISGAGFSTTAGSNTVTFGGTPATVTAATASQLTVTAPAAGEIAVSTPTGSANTHPASFSITTTGPPTITSFSPATAGSGASLTVNGANFDTVPANDTLTVNVTPAQVSSATTTALQATVPASSTAGHLSVATVNGSVTRSDYLWIAPRPYVAANLDSTGTLPFGTATPVAVAASADSSLVALRVFDGTQGHRASIQVTSASASVYVYLYDAFGNVLQSSVLSGDFVDVATLRSTATYSVVVDPQTTSQTSATLTLYDVPADVTGTITPGGSPVTVTTTTPGQNAYLTFAGTAGQRISLLGTNGMSGQVLGCNVNVSILNPDTSTLAAPTCMDINGSDFIDATTLPATGTYTIKVDPSDIAVGSLTLTLYNVPADVTSSITAGGSAVTMTTTTPGQNGYLTFSGTAGERISLQVTDGMNGSVCNLGVSILNPDGSTLVAPTCMEFSDFIDVTTLATTGTYTIKVDPGGIAIGSATLTLYTVPADVTGTIAADGSAVTVTITTPGQNAYLTFSGTAGQRISLVATDGMNGPICNLGVSILNPDTSTLVAPTCVEFNGYVGVITLPTAGTYTIKVDPSDIAVGNSTLTLYTVPPDATGSVTIGGSSLTLTTTVPGQNASATFAGTSGQQVTVHVTNNTMSWVTVTVLNPDGTQLTSSNLPWSAFDLSTQTLPSTGTYTIVITPAAPNIGSITVNVTNP